jgi:hypothetical protein
MYEDESSVSAVERRRESRSRLQLHVRFLQQDGSEHGGIVTDVSVSGMNILSDAKPEDGSVIIAYVEDLGRLEGIVSRVDDMGIAVRLVLSPMRRDKLLERLGFGSRASEARRHVREGTDGATRVQLADGSEFAGRVIDLSLGGVAIASDAPPPVGEAVSVGKMRGRVVRHIPGGFAVEFSEIPPSRGSLSEQLMSATAPMVTADRPVTVTAGSSAEVAA